jgi:hypothetical protein
MQHFSPERFRGSRISSISRLSSPFFDVCQEYILDKTAPDTRFDQCLQGFRVLKKGVTMACTNSALCAKMARMSTLCRAEQGWQKYEGAET